jgi:hypothetical protein
VKAPLVSYIIDSIESNLVLSKILLYLAALVA